MIDEENKDGDENSRAEAGQKNVPADANAPGDAEANGADSGGTPEPGAGQPPRFTNMVEIQFEAGTQAEVGLAPNGALCEFKSAAEAFSATDMNAFLLERGCRRASRVFDDWGEDIGELKESALEQGVELPDLSGFYVLHFPEDADVREIATLLRKYPGVKYAAALPLTKLASAKPVMMPDDDLLHPNKGEYQWYIFRCEVDKVWQRGYTGKRVIIADVDSGFQVKHPDLIDRINMDCAFNAVNGTKILSTSGDLHHGTAVMGLVGAASDHKGIVGIAHDAELWPIEVGDTPFFNPEAWVRAIGQVMKYARGEERRVVMIIEGQSVENGNITQIGIIREAIQLAILGGAVVCVAAGNGARDVSQPDPGGQPFEPIGIIVGATLMEGDEPEAETNFGKAVVVAAPGDPYHDLTCNDLIDAHLYRPNFGATSGATAKVAGAVALMLEANGKLRHADIVEIFRRTGTLITSKPLGRLLNCNEAVDEALREAEKFAGRNL